MDAWSSRPAIANGEWLALDTGLSKNANPPCEITCSDTRMAKSRIVFPSTTLGAKLPSDLGMPRV